MKNAMRQVEEMGKELANALSAVASAEARAVVLGGIYFELYYPFTQTSSLRKEIYFSFP